MHNVGSKSAGMLMTMKNIKQILLPRALEILVVSTVSCVLLSADKKSKLKD